MHVDRSSQKEVASISAQEASSVMSSKRLTTQLMQGSPTHSKKALSSSSQGWPSSSASALCAIMRVETLGLEMTSAACVDGRERTSCTLRAAAVEAKRRARAEEKAFMLIDR